MRYIGANREKKLFAANPVKLLRDQNLSFRILLKNRALAEGLRFR